MPTDPAGIADCFVAPFSGELSLGVDDNYCEWDLGTGRCMCVFERHTDSALKIAITSDSRQPVTGSSDNTARLWNMASGQCLSIVTQSGAKDRRRSRD